MKKIFYSLITSVLVLACIASAILACEGCERATLISAQTQDANNIQISAKSAFLLEGNSGKIIYAKNETQRLPIASMVKITTLAVIYDALESGQIALTDDVLVSRNASGMGGSQAFLDFDSTYKVDELIKSIFIASANDSCVALAELIAGSEDEFVVKMNNLASRLGMTETNYENCTGLPAPGAYSCARDVATIYSYIMKSPYYADSGNKIWMYDLVHPSGRITGLTNTNKHSRFFKDCEGGKTGYTAEAGHCITVTANRKNLRPIAVIIGASDSKTRFAESARLMNFVFDNYTNKLIVDRSQPLMRTNIRNATVDSIDIFASRNYYELCKKGAKNEPEIHIELNDAISAPLSATTSIGKIIVTDNGKVLAEIDAVAGTNIKELSFFDAVKKVIGKYKI